LVSAFWFSNEKKLPQNNAKKILLFDFFPVAFLGEKQLEALSPARC